MAPPSSFDRRRMRPKVRFGPSGRQPGSRRRRLLPPLPAAADDSADVLLALCLAGAPATVAAAGDPVCGLRVLAPAAAVDHFILPRQRQQQQAARPRRCARQAGSLQGGEPACFHCSWRESMEVCFCGVRTSSTALAAAFNLPADPALHPSDLSSGSGSGGGDAALAQQQQEAQQQQQQLEQPHELSDTDSSEWVLPKNVAGGAGEGAGGGAAAGSTQQQQTQQVGTIGQQQQQPGSGGEAGQLYSSATVYAVRFTWEDLHDCVAAPHAALCRRCCFVRLALWHPCQPPLAQVAAAPCICSHCFFLIAVAAPLVLRRCATATATSPSFTTSSTTCG